MNYWAGTLWCWILLVALLPGIQGNERQAYRAHYAGTLQYKQGEYTKSARSFEQARRSQRDNFYFTLALAAAYSRSNKYKEADRLLRRLKGKLQPTHDYYSSKKTLLSFFIASNQMQGRNTGAAVRGFQSTINQLDTTAVNYRIRSAIHNAMGVAMIRNQGNNRQPGRKEAAHFHVHRKDMEAALPHFQLAVELDFTNEAAKSNYHTLADTLGITANYRARDPDVQGSKDGVIQDYGYLPKKAFRAVPFAQFDEVLLLVDISGSMVMEQVTCMGNDRFRVMKSTATFVLDQLPDTTAVGLATIGGDCGETPKQWIAVDSIDHKDMRQKIDFLYPHGTTPLLDMLMDAPALFTKKSNRKTIFFISDGENVCNRPGTDICEWAQDLANKGITINVLTFLDADFHHAKAFAEYTCLAERTGGRILYLDNLRCSLEYHPFDLASINQVLLPELEKGFCFGKNTKNLWIFNE